MKRPSVAVRKAPLIIISLVIMISAAAAGIDNWLFWLGIWVALLAQLALALGVVEESKPRRGSQLICGYDDYGNPIPFPPWDR